MKCKGAPWLEGFIGRGAQARVLNQPNEDGTSNECICQVMLQRSLRKDRISKCKGVPPWEGFIGRGAQAEVLNEPNEIRMSEECLCRGNAAKAHCEKTGD